MRTSLLLAVVIAVTSFTTTVEAKRRKRAVPLFTRCEVAYKTTTLALIGEIGGGTGEAHCWDGFGNEYVREFGILVGGLAARFGICETSGRYSAAGVGFTLRDIVAVMGQVDVGAHLERGRAVGLGVRVSPLAFNGSIVLSSIRHGGFCPSLAGVTIQASTDLDFEDADEWEVRYDRPGPPPMPREYEQRREQGYDQRYDQRYDSRRPDPRYDRVDGQRPLPPPRQGPVDPDLEGDAVNFPPASR